MLSHVEEFVDENALQLPVLLDPDEYIAKKYQAHFYNFIVFIVNKEGRLVDTYKEHTEESADDILNLLKKARPAGTPHLDSRISDTPNFSPAFSNFTLSGEGLYRFRNIFSPATDGITGAYGEPLDEGTTFQFYQELVLSTQVTDALTVGAMLRLTNLKKNQLNYGPNYFSYTYGSGYILYSPLDMLSLRAGYYDINFTPLTLQRWDFYDNPQGAGGGGGCAVCSGMTGAFSSQNLEKFSEGLTFEGARLSLNPSRLLNLKAIYARPFPAISSHLIYRQHLLGFSISSTPYRMLNFQLNGLKTMDEMNSLTFLPYETPDTAYQNELFSYRGTLNPLKPIEIITEYIRSFSTGEFPDDSLGKQRTHARVSDAYIVESRIEAPQVFTLNFGYLRLNPGFSSPFKAISYVNDRKGFRGAASVYLPYPKALTPYVDHLRIDGFFKSLEKITETPDSLENSFTTYNFGTSILFLDKLELQYNYITQTDNSGSACCGYNSQKKMHNLNLILKLAPKNNLSFTVNKINYFDKKHSENNYRVDDVSVLFDSYF